MPSLISKKTYLTENYSAISDKVVLDLACHSGESTNIILKNQAKHVYAVDIRDHLIEQAKKNIKGNVDFFTGDITDKDLIEPLVNKSQTIICLGALYHLFDHFRFFSLILKPHIEYCIIETVFGIESLNPEMSWGFENTKSDLNGWCPGCDFIPNGTPNLSWILQSARIFNFECDWVVHHGITTSKSVYNITLEEYYSIAGPSWPSYEDLISFNNQDRVPEFVKNEISTMLRDSSYENRRMVLRLYNKNLISSNSIDINEYYRWNN